MEKHSTLSQPPFLMSGSDSAQCLQYKFGATVAITRFMNRMQKKDDFLRVSSSGTHQIIYTSCRSAGRSGSLVQRWPLCCPQTIARPGRCSWLGTRLLTIARNHEAAKTTQRPNALMHRGIWTVQLEQDPQYLPDCSACERCRMSSSSKTFK